MKRELCCIVSKVIPVQIIIITYKVKFCFSERVFSDEALFGGRWGGGGALILFLGSLCRWSSFCPSGLSRICLRLVVREEGGSVFLFVISLLFFLLVVSLLLPSPPVT